MRKNKQLIDFLNKLTTAFCPDFDPRDGTQELYAEKLSAHSLTPAQWDRVFDLLTDRHQQRGLPPLGMIYSAISEVQIPERYEALSKRGKMIFRLNGYEYALIIQLEPKAGGGEHWVIASVKGKRNGETVELQKHVDANGRKISAFEKLALIPGAEFVGIYPDDPKLAHPGEMPTAEELAEIGAKLKQQQEAWKQKANNARTFGRKRSDYDDSGLPGIYARFDKQTPLQTAQGGIQ